MDGPVPGRLSAGKRLYAWRNKTGSVVLAKVGVFKVDVKRLMKAET